ncbi:hypothetical protein CF392_11885 [Tamilnaduibacter salinus]|uniref:Uncharacterized protein n=1 Tax=Tamilnaduibacter salinus TaxID=1484056 RepID=A0A2A2I0S9_9GAMM|nr:transporter substrate-binding domain-containing protein [Tamilnaduibacter salinus]PAV25257.1 hypothetical protein CF392_11885 [Tamilnaduibacter salinus]
MRQTLSTRWRHGAALVLMILAVSAPVRSATDTLRVGLEPFPPLITEEASGYSVEWLRAVAREAGMTLRLNIMPYSRAKISLMADQVDLIGHTPYGLESDRFYQFGQELSHRVTTRLEAFSLSRDHLALKEATNTFVGTPFGNTGFIAELTGLDQDRFVEGTLENVVNMLLASRVDTVVFERVSVMTRLRKEAEQPVYYRRIEQVDAGFAIRASDTALHQRLESAIDAVNADAIYRPYADLRDVPSEGVIRPDAE